MYWGDLSEESNEVCIKWEKPGMGMAQI